MRPRLVATVAALPGCALIADLGAEYTSGSGSDDAGSSMETSAPPEADADAPRADSPSPPDAPIGDAHPYDAGPDAFDAYVKPDTGGDPTCGALGQHDFCDAFDQGTLGAKWSGDAGVAGLASSPTPPSLPYCVQFSVGGVTTESDLFLDHLPLPMGRTVLTAQLQANVRTLTTGSVELSRIVAVDALAHELAGAYFIGTPQGVLVEICDKSACPYTHNMGVTTSSGWHTFAFDVTLGPSAASLSWQAYGLSGKSVSVAVNYGAPVAGIRTVIGAKSTDTSALTYWDNVTIDWY